MAMYLNNVNPVTIQKMGRWQSDTWMDYIHSQIATFSEGVATKMSHEHAWCNIAYEGSGSLHIGQKKHI